MSQQQSARPIKQAQPFGLQFAEGLPSHAIVFQSSHSTLSQELAAALDLEYNERIGCTIVRQAGDDIPLIKFLISSIIAASFFTGADLEPERTT